MTGPSTANRATERGRRVRACAQSLLRWAFVLLLAVSAITKLDDLPGFAVVVASYRLLPIALIPSAAMLLALAELSLAIALVAGPMFAMRLNASRAWLLVPASALVALHLVYLVWLTIAYLRGLAIPNCGCFGVYWPRPLTLSSLLEDGILVLLAVWLWRSMRRHYPVTGI
jgi:Methylamine utilisation protein MauE